jgi:hypothetical protein
MNLDKLYDKINEEVLRATCAAHDDELAKCQSCKFYEHHKCCDVWHSVFGDDLVKYIEARTDEGIRLGVKSIQIWQSRKFVAQSPSKTEDALFKSMVRSAKPSPLSVVTMDKPQK